MVECHIAFAITARAHACRLAPHRFPPVFDFVCFYQRGASSCSTTSAQTTITGRPQSLLRNRERNVASDRPASCDPLPRHLAFTSAVPRLDTLARLEGCLRRVIRPDAPRVVEFSVLRVVLVVRVVVVVNRVVVRRCSVLTPR